jgi:S1-C subfamily serine protease
MKVVPYILMILVVIFLLVCFYAFPCCAEQPHPQCVRVLVEDAKARSGGTGAYIGPGLVVTAHHVVEDQRGALEVLFPNWFISTGEVVHADKKLDFALIKLDKVPLYDILEIRKEEIPFGTKLQAQGYGYGPYRSDWGELIGKSDRWRVVENAHVRQGDSGGPLLDEQGRYCGTLWGSTKNEVFFTPSNVVWEAIQELK